MAAWSVEIMKYLVLSTLIDSTAVVGVEELDLHSVGSDPRWLLTDSKSFLFGRLPLKMLLPVFRQRIN